MIGIHPRSGSSSRAATAAPRSGRSPSTAPRPSRPVRAAFGRPRSLGASCPGSVSSSRVHDPWTRTLPRGGRHPSVSPGRRAVARRYTRHMADQPERTPAPGTITAGSGRRSAGAQASAEGLARMPGGRRSGSCCSRCSSPTTSSPSWSRTTPPASRSRTATSATRSRTAMSRRYVDRRHDPGHLQEGFEAADASGKASTRFETERPAFADDSLLGLLEREHAVINATRSSRRRPVAADPDQLRADLLIVASSC